MLTQGISDFLMRHRLLLFSTALFLGALAVWPARQLQFDQSIESLFSRDEPLLEDYLQSRFWFGEFQQVFVAYSDPDLFSYSGLKRLQQLSERCSEIPGVDRVDTLIDVLEILGLPVLSAVQKIDSSVPFMEALSSQQRELLQGIFLSHDGKTTAALLYLNPENTSEVPRDLTITSIRQVASDHVFPTVVAGMPVMLHDVFRYLDEDGWWLGIASSLLLSLVILMLFQSLRWVAIPLLLVHIAVIWTKAILVLTHVELTMVSTMLTSLVSVIGIATAVHLTVRYQELRSVLSPREAMRQTLVLTGPACFWTCLTTAAGFMALTQSQISPVQSFGMMLGIGSLLVLLSTAFVVPGGVLLGVSSSVQKRTSNWKKWVGESRKLAGDKQITKGLTWLVYAIESYPRLVGSAVLLVFLITSVGYFRLETETDFTKNFRPSSQIVQAYTFFEREMGGAGNWEVNLPIPDDVDKQFFERLDRLTRRLREIPGVTKANSLVDIMDASPVPVRRILGRQMAFNLLARLRPDLISHLWNKEQKRTRILLRSRERQTTEQRKMIYDKVLQTVRLEYPKGNGQKGFPIVTGTFVLFTFLIESLLRDQILTFLAASVLILMMLTTAFRSLKLAITAIIPNLCPIIMVLGVMGWCADWLDLRVNMATAMIASVSMGLAVDFSIHYLSRYRQERMAGSEFYDALKITHQTVGRSLVLATIALVAGFSVLCLSNFIPTIHFGVLVSVAMVGGLVGNLVILPLLLALVPGER